MLEHRLADLFKEYDPIVQYVLREVLRIEQQHITDPLRTNSNALKDIRNKIDHVIEEAYRAVTESSANEA